MTTLMQILGSPLRCHKDNYTIKYITETGEFGIKYVISSYVDCELFGIRDEKLGKYIYMSSTNEYENKIDMFTRVQTSFQCKSRKETMENVIALKKIEYLMNGI